MKELKELGFEYMPTLSELMEAMGSKEIITNDECVAIMAWNDLNAYRLFIKQQPKLGDFVPCIDGVPVDEPEPRHYRTSDEYRIELNNYQRAMELVMFSEDSILMSSGNVVMHLGFLINCSGTGRYKTYEQAINDGVKFKIK